MDPTPVLHDPRAPLVVAVTGHRHLAAGTEPVLRDAVERELCRISRDHPDSPLLLASGLAAGADSLVAEVALELGIPVVAVLPMPADAYRKDFRTEPERERLERLLARAQQTIEVLPKVPRPRWKAYRAVGAHLVRHAHVLLALWDGRDEGGPGGTAEVVARARGVLPPDEEPPRLGAPVEGAAVVHIHASRARENAPSGQPGQVQLTRPGDDQEAALASVGQALEAFNAEMRRSARGPEIGTRPGDWDEGAPETWGSAWAVIQLYRHVDRLATRRRDAAVRHQRTLTLMATATLAALLAYTDLGESPWAMIAYVVGLGATALYWTLGTRRGRAKGRHLEYRALAEALRVQVFWQHAGRAGRVVDCYLGAQSGRAEWIRTALLAWDLRLALARRPAAAGTPEERADHTMERWLRNQRAYAMGAAKGRREIGRSMRGRERRFVLGAVVLAAVLAVLEVGRLLGGADPGGWRNALRLGSAALLIGAALIEGYVHTRAFFEEARHYRRMRDFFGRAVRRGAQLRAAETLDPRHWDDLLEDVGREALDENAHWLVLHRDRPLGAQVF